jgi:hypothetical protein
VLNIGIRFTFDNLFNLESCRTEVACHLVRTEKGRLNLRFGAQKRHGPLRGDLTAELQARFSWVNVGIGKQRLASSNAPPFSPDHGRGAAALRSASRDWRRDTSAAFQSAGKKNRAHRSRYAYPIGRGDSTSLNPPVCSRVSITWPAS